MDIQKYYFISYFNGRDEQRAYNELLDEHPLEWLTRIREMYNGGYLLISWQEITKNEYEQYRQYF